MKAAERRHLRENELAEFVADINDRILPYRTAIVAGGIALIVILLAIGGYNWWRDRQQGQAAAALAEAMVILDARVVPPQAKPDPSAPPVAAVEANTFPSEEAKLAAALPKLAAAADAHPNTQPGISARYQQAGALMLLGKPADAVKAYDQVMAADKNGIYGRMAELGKAEALAASGQYDQAIATFKTLAAKKDGDLPADAMLMQLARTYQAAGRGDEAAKTYQQIIEEYPDSSYAADAKKALDQIRNKAA